MPLQQNSKLRRKRLLSKLDRRKQQLRKQSVMQPNFARKKPLTNSKMRKQKRMLWSKSLKRK